MRFAHPHSKKNVNVIMENVCILQCFMYIIAKPNRMKTANSLLLETTFYSLWLYFDVNFSPFAVSENLLVCWIYKVH